MYEDEAIHKNRPNHFYLVLTTGIQDPLEMNDNPKALAGRGKIAKFIC